jgi:NADPH2:quinone reductase
MRAWRAHELGTPESVLRREEVPAPVPGPGQALVAVEAVGLNFADTLMLAGQYQERPPLPFIPCLELAGRVLAVGAGARTPVGQRVIAACLNPIGGALAERVALPDQALFPIPDTMDAAAAAALFITYQTGYLALHRRAALRAGEVLLVHAGAGGVGSAAVQLGKAAGARVIATAGGPEKVAVCKDLGADIAVDYLTEDFVQVVREATGGRGADVIYDPVGGDVFDRSRRCIAWEGRLLVIGFSGGRIAQLPTNHVLLRNYSVVGVYAGEYLKVDPTVLHAAHAALMDLYERGAIRPLIGEQVPFAEAPAAMARITDRRTVGKVVVRMG